MINNVHLNFPSENHFLQNREIEKGNNKIPFKVYSFVSAKCLKLPTSEGCTQTAKNKSRIRSFTEWLHQIIMDWNIDGTSVLFFSLLGSPKGM